MDFFFLYDFTVKQIDQYLWQIGKNLSLIEDIIIECYSKTEDLQETEKMIYKEYGFSIQEDYIRQIVEIK